MAILQIRSENPNLSYMLSKNPASGMYVRPLRSGILFGYYPLVNGEIDSKSYVIVFRDGPDQISYKKHPDESFEYLNSSKYNNARFITDAIQEVMHSARTKDIPEDVPSSHGFKFNAIETDFKTIEIFQRYFADDIKFEHTEIVKNNYRLDISTKVPMTFRNFVQLVNLFGIFAVLNSNDFTFVTEDMIHKYVAIANELDVPYFIRYLIKVRLARGEKKFAAVKEQLEKSKRYQKLKLTPGDTHEARMTWISERIKIDKPIVDIGVGIDMRYLKMFIKKMQYAGLKYYAIDSDPEVIAKVTAISKARGWEDVVEVFESIDAFVEYYKMVTPDEKVDVICTEVLEHNHRQAALVIVDKITSSLKYDKFLVTVPNADFNKYYNMDSIFRHDDHKWEATLSDVKDLKESRLAYGEYFPIGDCVNDIPVTFGIEYKMAF